MTIEAWFIFASFWALFITTPGPKRGQLRQRVDGLFVSYIVALRAWNFDESNFASHPLRLWYNSIDECFIIYL